MRNQILIKSSQLHFPTAPLKCSLGGEFLCGAVPQPFVSTEDPLVIHGKTVAVEIAAVMLCQLHQEQTRQWRGMCLQQAICCEGCGAWQHFNMSYIPKPSKQTPISSSRSSPCSNCPLLNLCFTAALLSFAQGNSQSQKCCIMFGPQKQEQHAILPTSCSL